MLSAYMGHVESVLTALVSVSRAGTAGARGRAASAAPEIAQELAGADDAGVPHRSVGPSATRGAHTIASYRDTMRLLFAFAQQRLGSRPPGSTSTTSTLSWRSLPDHLERQRGNSARTRNNRLAAIHSLFAFASLAASRARGADPASDGDPAQAV